MAGKPHQRATSLRGLKRIPEYPAYLVNRNGDVFSTRFHGKRPILRSPKPALRKLYLCPGHDGYLLAAIVVCYKSRVKYCRVNRLVCSTFHGPPPSLHHEAQHKNGILTDNRSANLKWGLPIENAKDRERHGHTARGERQGAAKLSARDVVNIRRRYTKGETQKSIASDFNVWPSTVRMIIIGRTWGHV
jgi:hypothetical protein